MHRVLFEMGLMDFRFSVAWYPIYRVPERTLFRASFLTYHSLGHLVQRHVPGNSVNDTSFVVSPVLGLESYNAKVGFLVYIACIGPKLNRPKQIMGKFTIRCVV